MAVVTLYLVLVGALFHTAVIGAAVGCHYNKTLLSSPEDQLFACLQDGYQRAVRPAVTAHHTVNVTVNMVVVKVIDLDEKRHVMTTNCWLTQIWNDTRLSWNPDDFEGVNGTRIPSELLWTPDVVVHNNAAPGPFAYVMDKLAVVRSSGLVMWVPHARLQTYCDLDLTHFPFDSQHCSLVLGSWTYDEQSVNITLQDDRKMQNVYDGKEWRVSTNKPKRYVWEYEPLGERYPGIIFSLSLQRVSAFHRYMFIMPTTTLAFLILLLHFIPAQSGERIMLGSGLLVTITLLLLLLESYLPTELGTVPVIAAYLAFLLVLLAVSLTTSVLVLNFYHQGERSAKLPGWIRWLLLGRLSTLLCLRLDRYTSVPTDLAVEEVHAEREFNTLKVTVDSASVDSALPHSPNASLERTLDDIRKYLRVCAARTAALPVSTQTHRQLVHGEWHHAALVIDRLLFIVFLVITILVTMAMYGPTHFK